MNKKLTKKQQKQLRETGAYEMDLTPKKKKCIKCKVVYDEKKNCNDLNEIFQDSEICYNCFVKMGCEDE